VGWWQLVLQPREADPAPPRRLVEVRQTPECRAILNAAAGRVRLGETARRE